MLCEFCGKSIPESRSKNRPNARYCSSLCISRKWYIYRENPVESILLGNPSRGILWEEWFIKKFGATRPSEALNTPFDFWWEGNRIDLKVANLYKRPFKRGKLMDKSKMIGVWSFGNSRYSVTGKSDFCLCIGLVKERPQKAYKIPSELFGRGITLSPRKSKYDKFIIDLEF